MAAQEREFHHAGAPAPHSERDRQLEATYFCAFQQSISVMRVLVSAIVAFVRATSSFISDRI
jgi:hypothetical protein